MSRTRFSTSFETPRTILVVDDDAAQRTLMWASLQQLDVNLIEASDGYEAIEQFQKHQPLLVVMDIQMPGCDGYEACAEIRKLPGGKETAIMMVTGLEDMEAITRAYEAGGTDFVTKPINWLVLVHRVRYLLRAQQAFVALRTSRQRLAWAQRAASLGNWDLDVKTDLVSCSREILRILRIEQQGTTLPLWELLDFVHTDDTTRVHNELRTLFQSAEVVDIEHRIERTDGVVRTVHHHVQRILGADGRIVGLHGILQDVTERKIVEERIRQLAYHDNLTGLPNRQNFMEAATRALQCSARDGRDVSMLYFDLDRFKKVNDTLGHEAGDTLLRKIADRLTARLDEFADDRDGDWELELSRLGGDEFVLLASGRYDQKDLSSLAGQILAALADPVWVSRRELMMTGSMGIARHPQDGRDVDTLLKHADTAMYHAKHTGRNHYEFYDGSMSQETHEKLTVGAKLKQALAGNELSLHYQPQIRTSDGRVTGFEALLRWQDPELGIVHPSTFIAVAEEMGLIDAIGEWVLREACRQAADWRNLLGISVKMAVNVSNRQFIENRLETLITDLLRDHALPAQLLELEITESTIMQDVDETRATLLALRSLGVQVAIDDFGTGYSSMSTLKSLPLDTLKIDRSFITDVSTNSDSAAIVRAIMAMAGQLGLQTIAEGVETLTQFAFLQEHRCDQIQGYLVGRPMPAEEAEQFLRRCDLDGWKLNVDDSTIDQLWQEPVRT